MLKRNEHQAILEQFNRRMGRPLLSSAGAGAGGAAAGAAASLARTSVPSFNLPRLNSGGASINVGAKASAAAQDVAARLAKGANLTAAKASAAAAGESMRDSMSTAMRAMKSKAGSLRFMQRDQS